MESKRQLLFSSISGGYIVGQLAAIHCLSKFNYKPDVFLGASGGSIVNTIYVSSDYKSTGIERISKSLSSSQFVEEWIAPNLSKIIGFFHGSLYKHPKEHTSFTMENITPRILIENEIWIQTYDIDKKSTQLLCSTSEDRTLLHMDVGTLNIGNISNPIYLDGDAVRYSLALKASSSIPAILPPIVLDSLNLIDGGVDFSSPLIPFSRCIREMDEFEIVYISGYNIDNKDINIMPDSNTILDIFSNIINLLLRGHISQDRLIACDLICPKGQYIEEFITLKDYFERKKGWKRSFLEIYPSTNRCVNITHCECGEINKMAMEIVENDELLFKVRYVNYE